MNKNLLWVFIFLSSCLITLNAWANSPVTWKVINKAPYPVTFQYFATNLSDPAVWWSYACDNVQNAKKEVVESGKTASLTLENSMSLICINVSPNSNMKNDTMKNDTKNFEIWGAAWPTLYYSTTPFDRFNARDSKFNTSDPCSEVTNKDGICDVTIPMPIKKALDRCDPFGAC